MGAPLKLLQIAPIMDHCFAGNRLFSAVMLPIQKIRLPDTVFPFRQKRRNFAADTGDCVVEKRMPGSVKRLAIVLASERIGSGVFMAGICRQHASFRTTFWLVSDTALTLV